MKKVRSCYKACDDNDVVAARRALEEGFEVNRPGRFNNTLLHVSAGWGYTEIVSLLLEYKADVNVQNCDGDTPLHECARNGGRETASLLLEKGADVNVQNINGDTPIHLSALHGSKEISSLLLANMDNVNVKNNRGSTPLHYCASSGCKEVVSMLLDKNADVNVKNQDGQTPLHQSTKRGQREIVSLLLASKADVNVQDNNGWTPLHCHTRLGHTEIVSLLLANKADVNVECKKGLTPIDYASNRKVEKVLLQHGAVPDKQGRGAVGINYWSQRSTTKTSSVQVTLIPGVEDTNDRLASTSVSHTRTLEINNDATNTIRNDESDPAEIYENTNQDTISGPQTISTSGYGPSSASALAGRVEQSVNDCLKGISSKCQPSISTVVSTSQKTGAAFV